MTRVAADNAVILCYDMRYPNPWNRHVRAIRRADLRNLLPGSVIRLTSLTLLPPLARIAGSQYGLCAVTISLRSTTSGHRRAGNSKRCASWNAVTTEMADLNRPSQFTVDLVAATRRWQAPQRTQLPFPGKKLATYCYMTNAFRDHVR